MEEGKQKRSFDKAFKISAVKMVEDGQKVAEVARSLGIHDNLIHNWKKKYASGGEKAFVGKGHLTEIMRLRRELESAKKDNEVLKKAIGIFSEEQGKSTNS
ncbi:MAG: transposase [Candidatus Firestonebacteria bacterium]|nr:transposase [Candidatus Firestonebacteria bacterium]